MTADADTLRRYADWRRQLIAGIADHRAHGKEPESEVGA